MRRIVMACVVCGTAAVAHGQPPPEPAPQDIEVAPAPDAYADTDPSALSDFRPKLAPYGTWIDDPTYGTVWIPHRKLVGDAFAPYQTAGHWAHDGQDYVWVSDYPWGWIAFHYGRWVRIDGTGWAWIAGRAYAPAWVDWRVADDYDDVGWSPLAPEWIWWDGVAVGLAAIPAETFSFVPAGSLFDDHVDRHIVHGDLERELLRGSHRLASVSHRRVGFERGYVRGPDLQRYGDIHVVRTRADDKQLTMARQYARPATARALGATPPSAHKVRTPAARPPGPAPRTTPPPPPPPPPAPAIPGPTHAPMHHPAPAAEPPHRSAPDPTPPRSPATPAPSSSEPGAFDSAAGIARA